MTRRLPVSHLRDTSYPAAVVVADNPSYGPYPNNYSANRIFGE